MPDDTGAKLDQLLTGIQGLTGRIDAIEARKDAVETVEGKLDKIADHLDSLHKRMDSYDEAEKCRKDSEEKKDKEEEEEKAKKDAEEKAKKDASKKDDEKSLKEEREENGLKRDDADKRHDSVTVNAAEWAAMQSRLAQIDQRTAPLADEDRAKFVSAQDRANRIYQAFGDAGAPRWLDGESLQQYRQRLAQPLKKHSKAWAGIEIAKLPEDAFVVAETAIYHDAQAAAEAPVAGPSGGLRRVVTQDAAGRRISRFYGDPEACWGTFKDPVVRALVGFGLKQ